MSRSPRWTGRLSPASSWWSGTRTRRAAPDMNATGLVLAERGVGPASAPPRKVLELVGVGKRYGTDVAVHALTDIALGLERGDWLAITGPSGSGKSTLLNIIGCLDRPTSGTYLFEGIDIGGLSEDQRAGLRSRRIGFVFQ